MTAMCFLHAVVTAEDGRLQSTQLDRMLWKMLSQSPYSSRCSAQLHTQRRHDPYRLTQIVVCQ